MKFPRNAKILRSHFDVAPFAAVLFLLLMFIMLGALMPIAGIPLRSLQPPEADNLPGTDHPTVAMAVDASLNLYYKNQIVNPQVLSNSLRAVARTTRAPLTLIIHADKAVSYDTLVQLTLLASNCGITNTWLATLPRVEAAAIKP